jgi:hypothetical protein
MVDPRERVRAEIGLIEATLAALDRTARRKRMGQVEWMAVAGFICNVYSGIENILKNALRARGVRPPLDTPSSHRDLRDLATSSYLLTSGLRDRLDDYRSFRHFFVHGYGIMLRPAELKPLAEGLPAIWKKFCSEIEEAVEEGGACNE